MKNRFKSAIQWTDVTVNFWMGCTKVSEGCKFCYMHRIVDKVQAPVKLTTVGRINLTGAGRFKLTTSGRSKLTTC